MSDERAVRAQLGGQTRRSAGVRVRLGATLLGVARTRIDALSWWLSRQSGAGPLPEEPPCEHATRAMLASPSSLARLDSPGEQRQIHGAAYRVAGGGP